MAKDRFILSKMHCGLYREMDHHYFQWFDLMSALGKGSMVLSDLGHEKIDCFFRMLKLAIMNLIIRVRIDVAGSNR